MNDILTRDLPGPKTFIGQDTLSSCKRNAISDVNFRDSANIVFKVNPKVLQDFPFVFNSMNRDLSEKSRSVLVSHLRSGEELPKAIFNNDWFLPFLLLTFFIYGLIQGELSRFFKDILKLISFRGIKEMVSKDAGSLFQWQSTLFNLSAFMNISIFIFLSAVWFNIFPSNVNQVKYSIVSFVIIVSAITIRHMTCLVAGNLSENRELFSDYLFWIYQVYRLASMFLLVISVLILYSGIFPVNQLFNAGYSIVALLYFLRIGRLFLIFINRHVSIFYLILYLCALEILPFAVVVKYAAGIL